ncbi:MAG: trypsin-like peptidase domain-containing protein [Candidatus Hydrogenedentes bacterium]|nr:trypsin-like peptidase domain-containing protein [Candidatus Hydrogenedentota bacterium]
MRLILSVLVVLFAMNSHAAEPCETCSGEPQYPEAETFLQAHGYAKSDHTVLMSWSERTHDGTNRFVTGFHVKSADGSVFDIYSDGADKLISEDDLKKLGIKRKNWDLKPVEKLGETPPALTRILPEKPVPTSVSKSIAPRGGAVLPEIDWARVTKEDAERREQGKGAKRIGVLLNLVEPAVVHGDSVTAGEWTPVDGGGSLWSFAMLSPDALGMRVHFSEIELPLGARVVVYNGDDTNEAYGPYFGPAPGASDLWSATVFGETVVVECFVPEGADRSAVRLTIDQATHQYVPFGKLTMAKGAGACELDVTCYSAWATTAKGVAGIGSVGQSGVLWCTGSLLADTDNSTTIPYFLTANHCVGSQSSANNIEVYWLYQTSTCNGNPPSPTSVPRTTGGAQLLASANVNSGTDFALLRLNNSASTSASYLGWASAEAGIGTATTCVHHPSGDFKRISFSDITNVAEDLLSTHPRDRFHQNTWRVGLGVTEPGSSGSPLFIESTQQVIGQLWGGPSYCGVAASGRLDYYGRFDKSFPLIEQYLDPEVILDGTIEVIKPTSANSWAKGRERRIKWGTTGNTGDTVKIDLYQGGIFSMTLKASTRNDGKWKWTIPLSLSPASNYFIRVSSVADSGIFDNSDNFTIRD